MKLHNKCCQKDQQRQAFISMQATYSLFIVSFRSCRMTAVALYACWKFKNEHTMHTMISVIQTSFSVVFQCSKLCLEITHAHTHTHAHAHARTHTHTHINSPLYGTTRVSRYQKGKNQSGFYWSKRQWVAVASAGPYASLHLAPGR